jgi:hypothetical protein
MQEHHVTHPINAATEVVKATPSLGAIFLGWLHVPIEKWAVLAGLAFIVAQMAYLLWRWWRDIKHERQRDRRIAADAMTNTDRVPL